MYNKMSAVPSQLLGLVPKVSGLKGLNNRIHEIYPVNASLSSQFSPQSVDTLQFNIPALPGWLNPTRSYLKFNFKADAGSFPVGGIYPFSRMDLRVGNSMIESVQNYHVLQKMLSNMEPYCAKKTNAHKSGDWRANNLDSASDFARFEKGQVVEHGIISGVLGRDFNEHYIPISYFANSGGEAIQLSFYLNEAREFMARADGGMIPDGATTGYVLENVCLVIECVELPINLTTRMDKELYSGSKVSLPFKTFRSHTNHIPQGSQNAELSINENSADLEASLTAIRPQVYSPIYDYADDGKSNLDFVGGHLDFTKSDLESGFTEDKIGSVQWRFGTNLYPQRRLETSAHDSKDVLLHTLATLDKFDDDAWLGGLNYDGTPNWDNGAFMLAQSFKSSRDDYNNGIAAASIGGPLELSISLAKPATKALKLETFCRANYTLNLSKGGATSVLNSNKAEQPVA